jgi:phosphate transport system permease protein
MMRGQTTLVDPNRIDKGLKREVRKARAEDTFDIVSGAIAGISVATLLFGWFSPLQGAVGWALFAYGLFLAFYALLISFSSHRLFVVDRLMTVVLYSAGFILITALVFVVIFTIGRGQAALFNWNFITETMQLAGPLDPLTVGGIQHAIVGTLIQISIALLITVPLGLAAAVFLNEIGGKFARFVRTISDAMTALPSIVAGLFIYAVLLVLDTQRSGFAAAAAISVMMLPIIIRAADVVLRLVPGTLREASLALGSSQWETVRHVVLPTSRSGLVTSVILGTARGIGETSPVLLTSGITANFNANPFEGPMISLPLQVFDLVKSPEPNMIARGFGTATVLLLVVLALFTAARIFGGRGPGEFSARQARAMRARSQADLVRMTISGSAKNSASQKSQSPPLPRTSNYQPPDLPGGPAAPLGKGK